MAGWGGFSEDDLHRLKKNHLNSDELETQRTENIRKANFNAGPKRQKPREKIKSRITTVKRERNEKSETTVEKTTTSIEATTEVNSTPESDRQITQNQIPVEKKSVEEENVEEKKIPEIIVEPERIQEIELSSLQKMQQKQKEIEDQNKKKKAALQETINTRFKKTQAEANTLKYVHKELAHLDNLLSADVSLLRDTIEDATREYHYALKRYDQAEAEFVSAKVDLHSKTEKKEILTEHLLAVIQQNEERKAKKLEELMATLDVSEEGLHFNYVNHDDPGCTDETSGIKGDVKSETHQTEKSENTEEEKREIHQNEKRGNTEEEKREIHQNEKSVKREEEKRDSQQNENKMDEGSTTIDQNKNNGSKTNEEKIEIVQNKEKQTVAINDSGNGLEKNC